jgi:hypothetical protein
VLALDRRLVRRRFEERFSAARMGRDYVNLYRKLRRRASADEQEETTLAPNLLETNGTKPYVS